MEQATGANWRTTRDPVVLKAEQARTLANPRRRYGFWAGMLFLMRDLFYGRRRTLSKFKVLEVIARVPYQSWEHVAYIAMTHMYGKPHFARRIFEFVKESRAQQDNEQWHLLILEEMVQGKGTREGFLWHRVVPQVIAAEHEYMELVRENPAMEKEPFVSDFEEEYGRFASTADLFRRIGLDERLHKEESVERMAHARFA